MSASLKEQLQLLFGHAIATVTSMLEKDGSSLTTLPKLREIRATNTAVTAAIVACEKENMEFGDYQCNDAMRVSTCCTWLLMMLLLLLLDIQCEMDIYG